MIKIVYIVSALIFTAGGIARAQSDWDVECGTQLIRHAEKFQPENVSKLNNLHRVGPYLVGENHKKELVVQSGKNAVVMSGPKLSCTQTATAGIIGDGLALVAFKYQVPMDKISAEVRKDNEEYKSLNLLIHYCRDAKDETVQTILKNFGWQRGGPPAATKETSGSR